MHVHKVIACESDNATGTKRSKASELVVGGDWIDSYTEFVILASNGIWEVSPKMICYNLEYLSIRKFLLKR